MEIVGKPCVPKVSEKRFRSEDAISFGTAKDRLEPTFRWKIANKEAGRTVQDTDFVCIQSPLAGREVEIGSTVTLTRIMAPVPNVEGMTISEAEALLHGQEGFKVTYNKIKYDGHFPVSEQSPKALDRCGAAQLRCSGRGDHLSVQQSRCL